MRATAYTPYVEEGSWIIFVVESNHICWKLINSSCFDYVKSFNIMFVSPPGDPGGADIFAKQRNSQKHSFSRFVRSMVRWGNAPVYVFPILFGWAKSRGSVTVRPWFGLESPPCGEN